MDFIVAVNNFGDTRSGGLAGPMGLFIIVLLSVATVLLIRNMNKRLRRLPESFPDPRSGEREAEVTRLEADLAGGTAGSRASSEAGATGPGGGSADDSGSDVDRAAGEAEGSATRAAEGSATRAGDGSRNGRDGSSRP